MTAAAPRKNVHGDAIMRPKRIGTRSASRPSFWASRISTAPRRRSAGSTTPSPRRGARSRASRPTARRLLGDVLAELVAASGPRCPDPPGSLTRLTESDGTRPPSHTVRGPFRSVPTPSGRRLPRGRLRRPDRAACDAILWRRIGAVTSWSPGSSGVLNVCLLSSALDRHIHLEGTGPISSLIRGRGHPARQPHGRDRSTATSGEGSKP